MTSPIRILELRSVRGTGGGPEKTILLGAAHADPQRFVVSVCYLRHCHDAAFAVDLRALSLGVDYVEIRERHALDPGIWLELRRLTRERKIDIVHAHDYKTDLLALLLARSQGVVPLATAHGWVGTGRRERIYYWFDRRLLQRFPMVVAVSSKIRDQLLRTGMPSDRIRTIRNGIDPAVFRRAKERVASARAALGWSDTDLVVGSVGRVETQKRYDLLLEALARLRPKWPRLRLVIAGDGSLRSTLRQTAGRLGLADCCRFPGHCDDVISIYHALDLYVQSSDDEGTSNALLEAMALEVPVVATAVGGTDELITHGVHGLLVPAGDATLLATTMDEALADRGGALQRAAAARARVENELSFAARMQAIEALYHELGTRRRAQP